MSILPAARQSPRIENGIIKWYEGDTFELALTLELTDQDGEDISIAADSGVTVVFRDRREETVKTFSFTNIVGNTVTLDFDAECSALFPKGEYSYKVVYAAGEKTTVAQGNLCAVE